MTAEKAAGRFNILRAHAFTLTGSRLALRPLTEQDWGLLLPWNRDPETLYYSEGGDVASYTLEQVQEIYRGVSQSAFCFIIELQGKAIGEGWLQQMNLERIQRQFPRQDCRRIDLVIGERAYRGQGLGTEAIRLLCALAWQEGAAHAFGCDIADYNVASLRAFAKAGFREHARMAQLPGSKAAFRIDMLLSRGCHAL